MATTYILQGSRGRYYIGCTDNFDRRFDEHNQGKCHTTKRLGLPLKMICRKDFASMAEARWLENKLKNFKNPQYAISYLNSKE